MDILSFNFFVHARPNYCFAINRAIWLIRYLSGENHNTLEENLVEIAKNLFKWCFVQHMEWTYMVWNVQFPRRGERSYRNPCIQNLFFHPSYNKNPKLTMGAWYHMSVGVVCIFSFRFHSPFSNLFSFLPPPTHEWPPTATCTIGCACLSSSHAACPCRSRPRPAVAHGRARDTRDVADFRCCRVARGVGGVAS